jgi:hypothetical protein
MRLIQWTLHSGCEHFPHFFKLASKQFIMRPCKCWMVTFQPSSIDTRDCLLIIGHSQLLLFDYYSIQSFYCSPCIFNSDSGMYSRYFDPVTHQPSSSKSINIDFTVFVLV